ncbi:MAG: glycosyltransferase family 4 protein [Magnetococcus sp. YQC-5]
MTIPHKTIFLNRFFYPDYSATSQMLTELAFDLAAQGETLHVVTSRQCYENPSARLPSQEEINGVTIHRIWTSRFGRRFLWGRAMDYLTFYLSLAPTLLRLVNKGDLVVAMTDPPMISLVAAWVVRIKKALLINWIQDLFPEVAQALEMRGMHGLPAKWLRQWRNRSLIAANINVVLGHGMARKLHAEGVASNQISIIHNWSDGTKINAVPPAANPLRQEWGLVDRFVVGYSGNMGRAHEFETLLAAAQLLKTQPKISFLFIGGGAKRQTVLNETKRLGLDNIHFQPYQPTERLAESLSVADVHWISLLPAMEGLIVPSKFYGSAAVGRPILFVGDPAGEIASLLQQFQCGYSIMPGDAQQLAERIAQLATDDALRQQMGAQARHMLEERFDRSLAVQAWQTVLQEQRNRMPFGQ